MPGQYQTIAEIEAEYDGEWVLVNRVERGRNGYARGGQIVAHGSDKEAILAELDKLPLPHDIAFFFAGPVFEDAIYLL